MFTYGFPHMQPMQAYRLVYKLMSGHQLADKPAVLSPTSYHCSTPRWGWVGEDGNDLLSQRQAPVSSALGRLTTVFGMGTGGATPRPSPPSSLPSFGRLKSICLDTARDPASGTPDEGASGAPSALSTASLRRLPAVHVRPIHQVISLGPYSLAGWETSSCGGLRT